MSVAEAELELLHWPASRPGRRRQPFDPRVRRTLAVFELMRTSLAQISRHRRRYAVTILAAAALAGPHAASAEQVQAYLLFETAAASDTGGTSEKLRSTSLGNCLQIVVGSIARDVLVHLACDESDGGRSETSFLHKAVLDLSRVDGVTRSTLLLVRRDAQ